MGYIQDKMTIKRLLKKAFLQIDYTGNIDQKIESILVKLANEITFEEAIKGKKFVNPKTKNKVNFSSLPGEEQKKIRGQFEKKVQESEEKGDGKGKKESPVKDPKQMAKKMKDSLKKDKKLRDKVVKDIKSPETKKKIVEGMKAHVKEEDLNKLGESLKNKDAKSFKESLPGIMKGLAKGLLIGLGVAVVVGLSGGMIANAVLDTADDLKQDAIDDLNQEYADQYEEELEDYLEEEFEGEDEVKEYYDSLEKNARSEILMQMRDDGFKIDFDYSNPDSDRMSDEGFRKHRRLYDTVEEQIAKEVLKNKPNIYAYYDQYDEDGSVSKVSQVATFMTEAEIAEMEEKNKGFYEYLKEKDYDEQEVKKLLWENGGEEIAKDQEARVNKMIEIVKNAEQKAYDAMSEDQRKTTDELYEEYLDKSMGFYELDPELQMRDELKRIIGQEENKIQAEFYEMKETHENLSKEIEHQKDLVDFAGMDKEELETKQKEMEVERKDKSEKLNKLRDSLSEYEKVNKDMVEARNRLDTTKDTLSTNETRLKEIEQRSAELEKKMSDMEDLSPRFIRKFEGELGDLEEEQEKLESENEKLEEKLKEDKKYLKEVSADRKQIGLKMYEESFDEKEGKSFSQRIDLAEDDLNVVKEQIKSLEVDVGVLDDDIERSQEKIKNYDSEQKEIVKNQENLRKQMKELDSFEDSLFELNNKGTSVEEMKSFNDVETEYNKKVQDKALKRASMNKFSKKNEMNLELLAEKLQEKLSKQVSNLGEKKKVTIKPKKTNKKASRNRDIDFDIKFI